MTTIILFMTMITVCYFIIAVIVAVYRQQQLNNNSTKDRAQQMIQSVLEGLLWPLILISYGAKKLKQKNFIIVGLLIIPTTTLIMSSCYDTNTPYQKEKAVFNNPQSTALIANGYTVIEGSDGCDYIYWYDIVLEIGGVTHSGSCRKCWARLDSLINSK